MTATRTQGITFAVDDVPLGTEVLETERLKNSVERLLRTPVEACDSYTVTVLDQPGYHSLIYAAALAYDCHYPLVLSPDAIWLTIAQGFAQHVANNAEALRSRLVSHQGKAELKVRRDDFVRGSPENPWAEVWPEFCKQIRDHIGSEACELIVSDFSTTGPTERAASEVVLMDCVQSYFEYSFMSLCGIPAVTLEGTVEDWEKIRERVGRLAQYEFAWWTDKIGLLLDEFVQAAKGSPTPIFWKRLYKLEGGSGGPYISGWLTWLLPYLKYREYHNGDFGPWRTDARNSLLDAPMEGPPGERFMFGLRHGCLPSSVSAVPYTWEYHDEKFAYEFVAGVTAVTQDATTKAIRPRIGWAVREAPSGPPRSVWDER